MSNAVEQHYGRGKVLASIIDALTAMGKVHTQLTPVDLAPVDEFHIRGREATLELAGRAALSPGQRVLDVGCGLGGSVRHLAAEHGCKAVGVDLTQEYVEAAGALARMVDLAHSVTFRQASALALPFDAGAFDVVWTEHAQMNIADKRGFYAEIARVLAPGGKLVFHDIFQGRGGAVHYPVPWAETASISALAEPESVKDILVALGFVIRVWEDKTQASLDWFNVMLERVQHAGTPPLGIHLLLGASAPDKFRNMARNLREQRIAVYQAVAVRPNN